MTRDQLLARIGKRVYRPNSCPCLTCKDVEENGIVIKDVEQTEYMADCAAEMGFNYCDEPL